MLNGSSIILVLVYVHFALFWKNNNICGKNQFSSGASVWSLVKSLVFSFYNKKCVL